MIPTAVAVGAALIYLFAGESLGGLTPLVKMTPVAVLAALVLSAPGKPAARIAGFGFLMGSLADAVIEYSFLLGLAVFLFAHLFYVAAFVRLEPRWRLLRLLPVAVWAAFALPPLINGAGPLALPVLAYGTVIFIMIWRAGAAVRGEGFDSTVIGLLGALLFGLSDTLLGYARFVAPLPASSFLIMATYWAGQTLLAACFMNASPQARLS